LVCDADDEILIQRLLEREATSGRPIKTKKKTVIAYDEYNLKTAPSHTHQNQDKYYAKNGIGSIDEETCV
jgi:hypothetical protein